MTFWTASLSFSGTGYLAGAFTVADDDDLFLSL